MGHVAAGKLIAEASGGADARRAAGHAGGLHTEVFQGAMIHPDDVTPLLGLLTDPTAFYRSTDEHVGIRRHVAMALTLHALRTDDATLVGLLRGTGVPEIYSIRADAVPPPSPACVRALVDGIAAEPLGTRAAAMDLVYDVRPTSVLDPVRDVLIGELSAPDEGGRRNAFGKLRPAARAAQILVRYSYAVTDLDELCAALAVAAARSPVALQTLAGVHAVHERFDAVPALLGAAATRLSLITGIRTAITTLSWDYRLRHSTPAATYPFTAAIEVAAGLATTQAHQRAVDELRAIYAKNGLRRFDR